MRRLLIGLGFALCAMAAHAQAPSVLPPAKVGGQFTGGCSASRPLPGDATTIAWSAGGDVCALKQSWCNGKPLFDIIVGGNTQTIKSVNCFPDVRRLAALLRVSPVFGTAGAPVSKLYDQLGGTTGFVQATSANQPAIWLINGRVSIAFDGFLVDFISGANADKFLSFPSIATASQNTTVYSAFQQVSGSSGFAPDEFSTLYSTGVPLSSGLNVGSGAPSSGLPTTWNAFSSTSFSPSNTAAWGETGPVVLGVISSSTNFCVNQNNEAQSCSGAALASASASGGAIGAAPGLGNGGFYGRIYGFMIAGAATATTAQQTALRTSLAALHGINQATPKYAILVDGASLDVGQGGLIGGINGYGWAEQMLAQIPYPIRMGNVAVSGATTANVSSTMATSQCAFFKAGVTNILFGPDAAAGNSIRNGETGAQAFSDLQTYLINAKACSNPPAKIFVGLLGGGITCVTSCSETQNYNNLVITNAATLGITPAWYSPQCPLNDITAAFSPLTNAQYFNQSPTYLQGHYTIVGYQNSAMCGLFAIQSAIGP